MDLDTQTSNHTYFVGGQDGAVAAGYDPTVDVDRWHQRMELAAICVCNGLAVIIIAIRIYIRSFKIKRKFRSDDYWIFAALFFLVIPHFVSQLGANYYGSGLHLINVTDEMMRKYWVFSWGYCGYYIVCSLIKISQCCCLLQILPPHLKTFRRLIYALCAFILSLGLTEALIWLFQCEPFLSNFVWSVTQMKCLNLDPVRYLWVGLSVPIDLIIIWIPFGIITRTQLRRHEKRVLTMVFAANLLGTIACGIGAYGIWSNRSSQAMDFTFAESTFVITNDIEILMYTLGASFPVLSPYFISYYAATTTRAHQTPNTASVLPSWRKKVTNATMPRPSRVGATTIGHRISRRSQGRADLDIEMLSSTRGPLEITVDWQISVVARKSGIETKRPEIDEHSLGDSEPSHRDRMGCDSVGSKAELSEKQQATHSC